ncbi:hypothetical protein VNO77_15158 [Canavalia gladiata]|uniref:Uncharacterized protein n=1 Tax=Canavalia gladiata TaxID=3824 RepID=A0AAN9M422_CANGL
MFGRGILGKPKAQDRDLTQRVHSIWLLLGMQSMIEEPIRVRMEGQGGIDSCCLGFSFPGTPDCIMASSLGNSD